MAAPISHSQNRSPHTGGTAVSSSSHILHSGTINSDNEERQQRVEVLSSGDSDSDSDSDVMYIRDVSSEEDLEEVEEENLLGPPADEENFIMTSGE